MMPAKDWQLAPAHLHIPRIMHGAAIDAIPVEYDRSQIRVLEIFVQKSILKKVNLLIKKYILLFFSYIFIFLTKFSSISTETFK
jgi:hypothetical protein